jgi:hypothetical protein
MTPDQLKAWRMSLPRDADGKPATIKRAAELLNGTPPNSYGDWEAGRRRIPKMLPLACYAVSQGWKLPINWTVEDTEDA